MERRAAFDDAAGAFTGQWQEQSRVIAQRITKAKDILPSVKANHETMLAIARICIQAGIDGHRGGIITLKAAKALATWRK